MPDLNGALDIIETNSKEVPNQYQHMMPVYISHSRETKSMAVFNDLELTEREWDALPFHIFTILGKKDSNDQPTTTLFKVERQTGEVQSLTGNYNGRHNGCCLGYYCSLCRLDSNHIMATSQIYISFM